MKRSFDGTNPAAGCISTSAANRISKRLSQSQSQSQWHASLELSTFALDAAQSGGQKSLDDIVAFAEATLPTMATTTTTTTTASSTDGLKLIKGAAVMYAEAASQFFLAGVTSKKLFAILTAGITTSLLHIYGGHCSTSQQSLLPQLDDFKLIVENLAICGYTGDDTIITEIFHYIHLGACDDKRNSSESRLLLRDFNESFTHASSNDASDKTRYFWLHAPSGEPLKRLWQFSAKKHKIRDASTAELTPGTRRMRLSNAPWMETLLSDFKDPTKPLIVDLGCGYGVSLNGLAKALTIGHSLLHVHINRSCNFVGCDLSSLAVSYASNLAKKWKIASKCRFYVAPVEPFMSWLRTYYPGPVIAVLIQFPTPYKLPSSQTPYDDISRPNANTNANDNHNDNANSSRGRGNSQLPSFEDGFMVTATLVNEAVLALTDSGTRAASGGLLYIQSNVEDVAVTMKRLVETAASNQAQSLTYLHQTAASISPSQVTTQRSQQWRDMGGESAHGLGWLNESPFGTLGRTETEATYMIDRKPVYRMAWMFT